MGYQFGDIKSRPYEWQKWQAFGNILHIHIHKCGGSSLRLALEVSNPESPKFKFNPNHKERGALASQSIQPASHALPKQIINDIGREEFMKRIRVSMCRNPFARIVSMYTYWLKRARQAAQLPDLPLHAHTHFFREFVMGKWPRERFPPQKHYLMYKGEVVVDNILRLENIQQDWTIFRNQHIVTNETIQHKAWIPKEYPLTNKSRQNDYKEYYREDKELIERVADMYREDLEYFNYEF